MEELTQRLGDSVAYVIQNAQGSVTQAHAIAQQLHANKQYNGFLTIATPTTQSMCAVEKERPIFIAAVTDPYALGIMDTNVNVSGTTDMVNVKAEIDMLVQLLPQTKTVGLLYSAGELNSMVLAMQMRLELEKQGLMVTDFTVSNEADIQAVVELACRKVDVILAPTDNTVASAISLIAALVLKYKKPLIVSDNSLVSSGALAARGVDYKESGRQTAQLAYKIFVEEVRPDSLPIEQSKSDKIVINQNTLAGLGLTAPVMLQEDIELI